MMRTSTATSLSSRPRRRPGDQGAGGRQLPREKGDLLVQLDPSRTRSGRHPAGRAWKLRKRIWPPPRPKYTAWWPQARANRFKLEHAIEAVDNQIANLRAAVATLNSSKATLELAKANLRRGEELLPSGGVSKEDLDVLAVRPSRWPRPPSKSPCRKCTRSGPASACRPSRPRERPLADVPPDLDQNFSSVRQALGELLQSAAQLGYFPPSWTATPQQAIETFYKQDPHGDLNRILARLCRRRRPSNRPRPSCSRRGGTWTKPS